MISTENIVVVGLDISTSCVGICAYSTLHDGGIMLFLEGEDFKKCKTIWEKADKIEQTLTDLKAKVEKYYEDNVGKSFKFVLAIEEPLIGFRQGSSSATTIASLLKFNGIVSAISRKIFFDNPTYISAAHARKLCGVKLTKVSISGISHKEQVFEFMSKNDLSGVTWEKKKSGNIVDWSRDATDAYVIAKGYTLSEHCVTSDVKS